MPGMATLPEGPALFFSLAEEMGLSLMQAMTTWVIRPRQKLGLERPTLTLGPLFRALSWQGLKQRYTLRPLSPPLS